MPLNSQTRARLREITNEVQKSEAQMDKMAENLIKTSDETAKMSDDELALRRIFGENYAEFKGKGQEAINHLLETKSGQVQGAFYRQDLGDIDLVWGNDEIGLKKIIDKHLNDFADFKGDTAQDKLTNALSEIIAKGNLEKTHNGFNVNFNGYIVGLNRGWNENGVKIGDNKWIVTAFDNNKEISEKATSTNFTRGAAQPQNLDEIIPNSNSQSQVPQKSLLEQIEEKEAELMRLKEMAKNADENAQKQGLNADESLTKKENKRFEEVLEKPAQKQTQNEPTQDIDKALKAQDEPKETPSIEKESLQLDEMPSQKINKLFDEILTPNYYQNEKAVFYENMIKNAEKLAQNDKSITSNNIKAMLNTNERVVIDKLDTQEALNLGFKDYENVKRTIDSDEIRHALKEHGENSVGAKNGKPFIDENDIANYPQITKTADEQLITKTKQNLPARVSFKQINGYYVIVEEVHNGQGELAFKTMFKENGDYKNSNAYKQATANPLFPHKTQGGNSLGSDEIIPNSKVQSQVDFKALSELMQNIEAKYEKAFNLNTIEKMNLNHIFAAHTALERLAKSLKDNTSKISEKDALEVSKFINENLGLRQTLSDELLRRWGDKSLKKDIDNFIIKNLADGLKVDERPFTYQEVKDKLLSNFDKIQEHYKEISNFYKAQQTSTAQTTPTTQDIKQTLQNNKGQLLIKDEKGKNHFINEKLVKAWQDEFKLANAQDDFLPEFSPQIKDILAKNGVDEIHLKIGSLIKLNARDRGEFIKHIKPTLQEPDFILKDESGVLFVKNIGKDKAIFASIAKNENGEWVISTNSYKRIKTLKDRIESNDTTILYQSKEASNQLVEAFTNTPFRAELDNVNSSENLGKSQADENKQNALSLFNGDEKALDEYLKELEKNDINFLGSGGTIKTQNGKEIEFVSDIENRKIRLKNENDYLQGYIRAKEQKIQDKAFENAREWLIRNDDEYIKNEQIIRDTFNQQSKILNELREKYPYDFDKFGAQSILERKKDKLVNEYKKLDKIYNKAYDDNFSKQQELAEKMKKQIVEKIENTTKKADESQVLSAYDKNILENAPKETIEAHLKSIEKDIDYLKKGIDFYKKNPEQDYNGEMIKFNEKLLTPKLQMQKAYKQRLDELNSLDLSYAPKRNNDEIQITLPKEKQTRFTMRQNAYKSLKEVEKTPLTNANDGRVAYLNKTGRQESLSDYAINESAKNGFDEAQHLATAQHLPALFENAKFKETTRDLKNNDKNVKIHRYTANFLLDNEPAQAQITLKETIAGQHSGNKIYTLKLESVSRLSPAEPQNPREALRTINDPKSSGFGEPSAKSSEIVSKIQEKFKFDEKKAKDLFEWHKDSSPLTKNDDGTPKVFYHATNADEVFEIFDKDKIHSGYGFWFGDDIKSPAVQEAKTGNAPIFEVFLQMKKPFVVLEPINKNNYKEFEKIYGRKFESELKNNEKLAEFENFVKKKLQADEVDISVVNWLWSIKKNGKWTEYRDKDLYKILTPDLQDEAQKYLDNGISRKIFNNDLPRSYGGNEKEVQEIKQRLIKNGYDSIIYADEFVVFDSKQIKSIDNAGSWTDSAGKITKEKPSDESARHSYFNPQSPNILHSNEIWGGGLAGGTLNGLEMDEDGNIIGFDPAKFVAGFIAGATGTKAVKSLFENPKFKASAQKFAIIQRIKAKRENTMKYNTFKKIDESRKYGSKMKLIGTENLNADIIAYALSKNKRFAINKLDEQIAKALNFKYSNDVRRTIQPDEVIHTLKRHGENSNLVKFSGQKPVTLDDIAKYQHYADNAKDKGLSFDKQGNEILVSFKRLDNDFYVVVEQIRKPQNELGFKDLYFGTGEFDESKLGKKISLPASS